MNQQYFKSGPLVFSPNMVFFTNHSAEVSALDPETRSTVFDPRQFFFQSAFLELSQQLSSARHTRLRPQGLSPALRPRLAAGLLPCVSGAVCVW